MNGGVATLRESIESVWRESVHPGILYPWPNKHGPGARFKDDPRDLPPLDCIPAADCFLDAGRDEETRNGNGSGCRCASVDRRNAGWIDKKMLRALNKTP